MTPSGWVFLVLSWSLILGLCVFCFRHIFHQRRGAHRG